MGYGSAWDIESGDFCAEARSCREYCLPQWGSPFTTALSAGRSAGILPAGARALGRRLNPYANLLAAFSVGYLAGSTAICLFECGG